MNQNHALLQNTGVGMCFPQSELSTGALTAEHLADDAAWSWGNSPYATWWVQWYAYHPDLGAVMLSGGTVTDGLARLGFSPPTLVRRECWQANDWHDEAIIIPFTQSGRDALVAAVRNAADALIEKIGKRQ